ncbi:MAG: PEP-CTERM sorting domain-containing protein [Verrucomicrobiota bacterium]
MKLKPIKVTIITAAISMMNVLSSYGVINFITFDEPEQAFQHGSIVTSSAFGPTGDQYSGVSLSVSNPARLLSVGATYNTNVLLGLDPDLQAPFSGGNIQNLNLGNALIIAEFLLGFNSGILTFPSDQSTGGLFTIEFQSDLVDRLSFAVIDFLNNGTILDVTLTDSLDNSVTLTISDLEDLTSGEVFGSNTANQFGFIDAADYGLQNIKEAVIETDDSIAIDNIIYNVVPEPSTYALLMIGLAILGYMRFKLE